MTELRKPRSASARATKNDENPASIMKTLVGPGRLAVSYSVATYLLFVLGPWSYPMRYDLTLVLMIIVYNLAIYGGFRRGVAPPAPRSWGQSRNAKVNVDAVLTVSFFVTLVLFPIRMVVATQNYSLDWHLFITKVVIGLSSAQENYSQRSVTSPPGIWVVLNYAYVLLGFIAWLYVPLVVLLWERASWPKRALAALVLVGSVLASVARGQNFGAFDVIAQLGAFILVRRALRGPQASPAGRLGISARRAFPIILSAVFLVSFFANTMKSRIGDQFRSLVNIQGKSVPIDESSIIWSITPPPLQPLLASISMYVGHGYAALSMAVREPFDSTFGLGSSYFLMDNVAQLFGSDFESRTFPEKLELSQGFDANAQWHTAYLWIANDVSLFGVPIVLFLLFFVFGRAWRDYVLRGNLFGALMMAPMTIFTVFISANNQLTGQPQALFGFMALAIAWLATRRRFAWPDPGGGTSPQAPPQGARRGTRRG